jgi:hypothetical protein
MRTAIILLVLLASSSALAAPCTELPVLFIVQDKSGSMRKTPAGGVADGANPSKWDIANQEVPGLASQFSSRLRFGVAMYPDDNSQFNCTVGTVISSVSTSAAAVTNAYAGFSNDTIGGGTPTAVSLRAVKNHIVGLGLTTPVSVLLITDGLPNCNASLNPATCASSTVGCDAANDHCGWGAINCVDDLAASSAALELRNAGIKVYVVGFDKALAMQKATLDAIANAGGTNMAYAATNRSELVSALNQIASASTTCCLDVCNEGAKQCGAGGKVEQCTRDATVGCTKWVAQTCAPSSYCQSGACVACQNPCSPGALKCSGNTAQQCVTGTNGCPVWSNADVCSYGEVCGSGTCNSCRPCTRGSTRCAANSVEACEMDLATGCTSWKPHPCASGTMCQTGACVACNTTCTSGAKRCSGKTAESCVANSLGCTSWQAGQTCTDFCSGGACGACGTNCTIGQKQCDGNGTQTCSKDGSDCPAWGATQACGASKFCETGLCQECAVACSQGAKRCGTAAAIEECRLTANGCMTWENAGQCDLGRKETCSNGACLEPCKDECAEGASQCANNRPLGCVRVETGCTVLTSNPDCDDTESCVDGACRPRCAADEFESCPAGLVCRKGTEGRACFPRTTADAGQDGAADAGRAQPVPDAGAADAGKGPSGVEKGDASLASSAGCGCFGGPESAPLLFAAALTVLAFRRRLFR